MGESHELVPRVGNSYRTGHRVKSIRITPVELLIDFETTTRHIVSESGAKTETQPEGCQRDPCDKQEDQRHGNEQHTSRRQSHLQHRHHRMDQHDEIRYQQAATCLQLHRTVGLREMEQGGVTHREAISQDRDPKL